MKKAFYLFTVTLTFLHALAFGAEKVAPSTTLENPPSFLWKISHDEYADTYCFGTIHVGYKEVLSIPPHVQKVLNQADALYTEIPMDRDGQISAVQYMIRKDGQTLEQSIGVENANRLKAIMRGLTGADNLFALNSLKTWAGSVVLSLLPLQLDPDNKGSLDETLYYQAQKAGKEVGGVETIEEQIGFFDRLSEAEQIHFMELTLDFMEQSGDYGASFLRQLKDTYVSGDADKMLKELMSQMAPEDVSGKDKALCLKIVDLILYQRNQLMVNRIKELKKANPDKKYFIAVGTAHLLGEKSVIVGLQDAGFKVSRITQ